MRGEAPVLWLGAVLGDEITLPDRLAGAGVEAEQVAHRPERVYPASGYDRGRARPGGVGDAVLTVVVVVPDDLARGLIQALHTFAAGEVAAGESVRRVARARLENAVGQIDAAIGNGWTRIAGADRRSPEHFRAAGRELLEHALLAPDAVPLRAEPLRPVVRPDRRYKELNGEADGKHQAARRIRRGHQSDLRNP